MARKKERPTLPEPVQEVVAELEDEGDYANAGEVIRHVFQQAGYDV